MTSPDLYGNEAEAYSAQTYLQEKYNFFLPLSQIFLVLRNITKGYNLISPLMCLFIVVANPWFIPTRNFKA